MRYNKNGYNTADTVNLLAGVVSNTSGFLACKVKDLEKNSGLSNLIDQIMRSLLNFKNGTGKRKITLRYFFRSRIGGEK
jgi:hypothetical protein